MKALIDKVKTDFMFNVFFDFNFRHRCFNQKIKMSRHIVSLQSYVDRYEQSAISAVHFLSSIKTVLPQIHLTLHASQFSMTESLNKADVME